jgi:hypothetical protein
MHTRWTWGLCLAAAVFFSSVAGAQQNAAAAVSSQPAGYDLQRESTIVGTVISYNQATKTPPLGAHVILQTSSGNVDVHVGDPRLLQANHFTIQSGDTLRIIGENVAFGKGTQFVARIIQNGSQALQVRSVRGLPLSYAAPRNDSKQGGVL